MVPLFLFLGNVYDSDHDRLLAITNELKTEQFDENELTYIRDFCNTELNGLKALSPTSASKRNR